MLANLQDKGEASTMSTADNPYIYHLYESIALGSKRFSGIVGDARHAAQGGYHIGRNYQPYGNYSVGGNGLNASSRDRGGDGNMSAGLDVSFNTEDMKLGTSRVINAMRARDPRVAAIREVNGTLDGSHTVNFDAVLGRQNYTPDATHLWHMHFGFFRDTAQNPTVLAGVVQVINGGGSAPAGGGSVPIAPPAHAAKVFQGAGWPGLPSGHYYGLITGPAKSHGGYYASERPAIRMIQQRLIACGFVPGVSDPNNGWADGKFEQPTADAVARFQHAHMPGTQFYGQVWSDDWRKLFNL